MKSAMLKYVGHLVSYYVSDGLDIQGQRRQLYAQGNTILKKFHVCSLDVKLTLFHTFC